jgi:scytalone dehydratase
MPASEFITMASDPKVLGNPLLKTQHFIGGTKWEKVSEDEIIGWHQLRVPHQKYTDETMSEVAVKGHAHSTNQHWYKKVDGEWKFAGLNPEIRWSEFDFDKVFEEGRQELGEKGEEKVDMEQPKVEKVEEKFDEKVAGTIEIVEGIKIGA